MNASVDETVGDPELAVVLPARGVPLGAGWGWMVQGWRLFAKAPLMWVISIVGMFVLAVVTSIVPIIGTLAFQALQPVLMAGLFAGCRSIERGGDFELDQLMAGFQRRFVPLLIVGAVTMLCWVVIFLILLMFVGTSLLGALMSGDASAFLDVTSASQRTLQLGLLVTLALTIPVMAAYWFAPALVMLNGVRPLAAMKASLLACIRNFFPLLVYSIFLGVALILALIPLGLGMLVWIPVAITSTYAAYREMFTEPRSSVPAA